MSFILDSYQISLHGQPLFQPIHAQVAAQQVLTITGASGSGKSTILADISGFLAPVFHRTGTLQLDGESLSEKSIEARNVGLLFQDDLLFPHLNVFENLAFGIPRKVSSDEKRIRILAALKEAELDGYADRDIATLSGGQRSRVAVLRTLLAEPNLILLDEPFSKLDKALRAQFRQWVFEHIAEQNIPSVLVTHDPEDIPTHSQTIQLEVPHA